ncbi:MAG: hypothetical protein GF308_03270 [Candidatus Heimdallarchaeota archaeon]|nr:hypothetical protein [Candidatus Heimdallarchaeota archaeon]
MSGMYLAIMLSSVFMRVMKDGGLILDVFLLQTLGMLTPQIKLDKLFLWRKFLTIKSTFAGNGRLSLLG